MRDVLAFTAEAVATKTVVTNDTTQSVSEALAAAIQQSNAGINKAVFTLERLEAERENWETTELAASRQRLYGLLTECYSYYLTLKTDKSAEVRAQYKKALETFVQVRGYTFLGNSHDMNRIVKSVFGVERRRVSAYSLALRAALAAGGTDSNGKSLPLPLASLATWLEGQGGVEEVRLGSKNKGMTAAQRADVAKQALQSSVLMTITPNAKAVQFDTDDVDKMVVLVATYRPNGKLEVSTVVKNDSAVRAALACHYSANKEAVAQAAHAATTGAAEISATAMALEQAAQNPTQ
jgi:hypothetical protein